MTQEKNRWYFEGTMTSEEFERAVTELCRRRQISDVHKTAAQAVLVKSETVKVVSSRFSINSLHLYRVLGNLRDALNGWEKVTVSLPTEAADAVRALADAYEVHRDVVAKLAKVKALKSTIEQDTLKKVTGSGANKPDEEVLGNDINK